MAAHDFIFDSMQMLLLQLPEMLALFVGILVSIWNMRRHPRPSVCLLLACVLLLMMPILVEFAYIFLIDAENLNIAFQDNFEYFITTGRSIITMGAYVLIFVAVYTARRPTPPPRDFS